MRRLIAGLALTALWIGSVEANVVEHRLDNGMKVIVKQDRRAPIAVSQVWYKVGSSYESGGITGISHVLEHMMFKGTKNHPPGEFSRIIAANGGDENAFTGRDYTAYFQTMASDRLEVSFELEADRMRNLLLLHEEFDKEVEVVKEERRMRTEDKPQSLTYERFAAGAYESSPYRTPVIGWMADLDALQVDDLKVWYRKWYAPNNATLVVVGDVEPDRVIQLAERHFGPLKPEQVAQPKPRLEPAQRGSKRIMVKVPARQPYLIMGYKTPVVGKADQAWEPYALEMLAYVLDGGSSARLSNNLIRGSKLAVAADTSYSAFTRLPGMLVMDAIPAPDSTIEAVEKALLTEIERFKKELVSEEEMERVRNQIIAAKVYEKDSVFYQAMLIGRLETVGLDWRLADEYVDHLKRVTAEQIRQVAKKYLVEDNLTVAVLEPLPMEEAMTKPINGGVAHVY
ncbi:MAG: peptidase M16 [gamma proteobacterium symbiont of Ctena orbiculata]|uniref:Insulinase family protein n=1 Tax=Candidatus Thiodiazotropha taylori TaxID=2792791 RepID=A0A944MA12_9GAMM|nr:insulinase family protein [Candidatus Thiodiazotropha taylori]PUB81243.1 MAG: peptidase M16 [gamma proteobacterium symbiont of Ctena orbiculata]MBT2988944.1 insulinase family protein [Candidatus Thiodiazotropha taylori]MBT2996410.1 insulinase family protein [Candidatus Thiodiazotropha taylori]MBT3000156.1 insulinase family protein [Candidatus Thiodiazotropha taylori]